MQENNTTKDNPSDYPALGRALLWLDRPGSASKIVISLYLLCAVLFAADFFYYKKTYVALEDVPGFYALYGFFMCTGLVLCAKVMRVLLGRAEDYYAPNDTQAEDHPDADLDRKSIHD